MTPALRRASFENDPPVMWARPWASPAVAISTAGLAYMRVGLSRAAPMLPTPRAVPSIAYLPLPSRALRASV